MTLKYKDSHEQDFYLLKQRQDSILQQGRISNICESLIFLFLCHKFAAEDDAIQEAMTDGGYDLGIDAVYIDYRPPDLLFILFNPSNIIQSLNPETHSKFLD